MTHTPRQRHPPSGCLRGITQLLPSALIQGLNIPGPGIKIGTVWEGPESAASAAGTHRRHPPGSPRGRSAPGGFAGFGDTHREGEPPKKLCVSRCHPCACWSKQPGPPGMLCVPEGCHCPQRRVVSPRDAEGDNCPRVISGEISLSVVPTWSSREWGPCPVPWLSVMPDGRSLKAPGVPLQQAEPRGTNPASGAEGYRGQRHR